MRKEKTFEIGDKTLTANELTVKQIMELTDGFEGQDEKLSDIDLLFPDRLPSGALEMSLGITREELEQLVPSEIEVLLSAVEEVNPSFASLMQRLANVGRQLLEAQKSEGLSAG